MRYNKPYRAEGAAIEVQRRGRMKNVTLMAAIIASGGAHAIGGDRHRDYSTTQLAKLSVGMAEHILVETGDKPDDPVSISTVSEAVT